MPRRKRVRTSRKKAFRARSKGKLFSRRGRTFRRRYVRRSRRNRYGKSRKFVRRYRSSSKFPYMKLVKHSVFLAPSDFLQFPFQDIINFIATAAYQSATNNVGELYTPVPTDGLAVNNRAFNRDWLNPLSLFSRWLSMCYSTQLINPGFHAMQQLSNSVSDVKLISFNPPHSFITGGAYFMLYSNIYQFFKFCGMKVKFIPHTRRAATSVPEYTGVVAPQQNNTSTVNIGYEPTGKWKDCHGLGKLNNNMIEHINDDDIKTVAPPQYRLWVNFDKISPMSDYLPAWALAGQMSEVNQYVRAGDIVLNEYVWNKLCLQSRLKYMNVFSSGVNTANLKSFSMTRPFKFYVRPYDVDTTLENPVAPGIDQTQVENSAIKYVTDGDGDVQQRKPKKQGWIRTPAFYPSSSAAFYNASFDTGNDWLVGDIKVQQALSAEDTITNNVFLVTNFVDANYYNPPLFNYFITRDDLEAYEGQNLLGVFHSTYNDASNLYRANSFEGYPNFNQCGKFKLTFYYRFKGPRSEIPLNIALQQLKLPSRNFNSTTMAGGLGAIGVRKTVAAADLPTNIDGVF